MVDIDWDTIQTEDDIKRVAMEAFLELGFSSGIFAYTPIGTLPSGRPGLLKRVISINFDENVLKQWFQYQDEFSGPAGTALSQSFDPIRRYMSQRILPERIILKDFAEDRNAVSDVVSSGWIRTLRNYGMTESIHVPIFSARGEYWALAAFRFKDSPDSGPVPDSAMSQLHWLATHFAAICTDRLDWRAQQTERVKQLLTGRELDCLYWAALGYSAVESAQIMGIQHDTVRQYIKHALKKLNARNKTQGIWLAYRLGYLALQ